MRAPSIVLAPAEYKIHRLGGICWKVPIPKPGGPIAFPVVQDFRAFMRFAVPGLALSGRGTPLPFGSLLGAP